MAGLVLSRLAMLHYEASEWIGPRVPRSRDGVSEQVASGTTWLSFRALLPILYAQGEVGTGAGRFSTGESAAMQTGLVDVEWFLARKAVSVSRRAILEFVSQWAEAAGLSSEDELEYLSIEQHLLYARLLLAHKQ